LSSGLEIGRPGAWHRLSAWAERVRLGGKLAIGVVVAAVAAGVATYLAFSTFTPVDFDKDSLLVLLLVDLVLILALAALVLARLVRLWVARRTGSAGSRLHVRMVMLFSMVAALPTVFMAVASALFFNLGVQAWFSEPVNATINASVAVARAYVDEHRKTIEADILAMATDINRESVSLSRNPARFTEILEAQAALRNLGEAMVIDGQGQVLARTALSFSMSLDGPPPLDAFERARRGEVAILKTETDDRVRALIRLDGFLDAYLFVGRFVDPRVLNFVSRAEAAADNYKQMTNRRTTLQITFAIIFIVVALLVLLAAVLAGLWIATRMVAPIGNLAAAAERVREGDLSARVTEGKSDDEIGTLARAFNRMTSQLASQRNALVEANRQLDQRRRFTEAVLSGVTAGVVGVGADGVITLPNRSASQLLDQSVDALIGQPFAEAVPEMAPLVTEASLRPERVVQGQVNVARAGRVRNLLVRVSAERSGAELRGFVVTFDDITDLVSAQRTAAWADVARRIAHEIKNPLTPIQLSAERLRRKYLKEISTDPEVFKQCTDTIVRQVGDIGRMVDEFSAFARMPAPVFRTEDMGELARQAIFLQQVGHPEITYECHLPDERVRLRCDGRQIAQALTNLLKNALEAIEGRDPPADGSEPQRGRIALTLESGPEHVTLRVTDNGRGLPSEHRERLTEPYVTTRAKGTGLGLAIVNKVMEEHGGVLSLADAPEGGAEVSLVFPRVPARGHDDSTPDDSTTDTGRPAETRAQAHGT
jgi:two-component system nitrogen regulation sensor histidine kinase NtrY